MKNNIFILVFLCLIFSNIKAQSTNGNQLFDNTYVHTIHVTSPYSAFFDTLEAHYHLDMSTGQTISSYSMCAVEIDGNPLLDSVGMKEKGFYSNWGMASGQVKRPFKIDFSEYNTNKKYDGLKKINLTNGFKDPSMMHDAVAYKLLRKLGLPAPRTSYAKLYLNGVYWGLYLLVEEPDKKFLDSRFADKNGNMYKCNGSQLEWDGTSKNDYIDNFEQSLSNNSDSSFADLIHLHQIITLPNNVFYDSLTANFDTEYFLKSIATDYLLANWDNMIGHGRNFWLYHSTTDNKFHWIPWDYNLAFSDETIDLTWTTLTLTSQPPTIWTKCMANTTLKNQYFDYVCMMRNDYFSNQMLNPYIDSLKTMIRPDLMSDPNKFFTINDFDAIIENDAYIFDAGGGFSTLYKGVKSLIAERRNLAQTELSGAGYNCVVSSNETATASQLKIYPTQTDGNIHIESETASNLNIELYDLQGNMLLEQSTHSPQTDIDIASLANGIYVIKVEVANQITTQKILKF